LAVAGVPPVSFDDIPFKAGDTESIVGRELSEAVAADHGEDDENSPELPDD